MTSSVRWASAEPEHTRPRPLSRFACPAASPTSHSAYVVPPGWRYNCDWIPQSGHLPSVPVPPDHPLRPAVAGLISDQQCARPCRCGGHDGPVVLSEAAEEALSSIPHGSGQTNCDRWSRVTPEVTRPADNDA